MGANQDSSGKQKTLDSIKFRAVIHKFSIYLVWKKTDFLCSPEIWTSFFLIHTRGFIAYIIFELIWIAFISCFLNNNWITLFTLKNIEDKVQGYSSKFFSKIGVFEKSMTYSVVSSSLPFENHYPTMLALCWAIMSI